ncbi:MAG: FKBP-type peptidyl-prolyl cis-trans isomerase [Sediminibacterium sp.]|jgi:FKBP-type peptidyl-prolyl cis-trans isomerase FkpA|nr:FKBP-type peptidyl-prolyl cis-trans isomerase [Hydrotalea sp.]MCU0337095.1 FKBP-type peptidyl-prolyl cis-trans isomerase [Sediminibacterium sp.]
MTKTSLGLLSVVFTFIAISWACTPQQTGCTPVAPSAERTEMINYCNRKGINFTEHPSGLLYEIIQPGAGLQANPNSRIFITYEGRLFNDSIFDAMTNPALSGWILNSLIDGWKIGIPLVRKGGRIKLVIPSALAYGCTGAPGSPGRVSIPANSPLYFEVNLLDVQ